MSLFHLHFLETKKEKKKEKMKKMEGKLVDDLALLAGIVGPLMATVQAWDIWVGQDASGVSLLTWMTFVMTSMIWLTYGIWHRLKLLIFTYTLWLAVNILIVVGLLKYGGGF